MWVDRVATAAVTPSAGAARSAGTRAVAVAEGEVKAVHCAQRARGSWVVVAARVPVPFVAPAGGWGDRRGRRARRGGGWAGPG